MGFHGDGKVINMNSNLCGGVGKSSVCLMIREYDLYDIRLSKRLLASLIERNPACGSPIGREWNVKMLRPEKVCSSCHVT